jgi:membrane protease YdiL (CAAX protease family)
MQPTLTSKPIQAPNSRLGVILRVAFFIALAIIGLQLLPILLHGVFGEVVAGTIGLFATGLMANLLTMRIFDRRPLSDIGLATGRAANRNFALGLLFGGLSAALMLAAPLLAGAGHLAMRSSPAFSWASLVFYLAVLLFGAAGEEMMFRGYAFQLLIQKLGPFGTVLPAGVLFGLAHLANPYATPLSVMNTVLWGVLLGYAFLRSRDLWLPIGIHYSWNAVLPLFGVNLSGLTIDVTRYSYRWDLSPLWSGGAYGPEGGLITTVFVMLLFFVLSKAPIVPQVAAIAQVLNEPA